MKSRSKLTKPVFIDERLSNVFDKYLKNLNGQTGYKDKVFSLYHFSEMYLANILVEDITQESVRSFFDTVNFRKGWNISTFIDIIIFICIEGLPVDERLYALVNLKEYVNTQSTTKDLKNMFNNDLSKYYFPLSREVSKNRTIFYIGAEGWLRYTLINYIDEYKNDTTLGLKDFVRTFQAAINKEIKNEQDFDYQCFSNHLNYFKKHYLAKGKHFRHLVNFYIWINKEYGVDIFENTPFPSYLLHRGTATLELANGYDLVAYNPLEAVPESDKWLFYYGNIAKTNSDSQKGAITTVDFSKIENETYRNWTKHYLWHDSASISTKIGNISTCVAFWNYLSDIKNGNVLTIYTTRNSNITPTINEIVAYKNYIINSYSSDITRAGKLYSPRAILLHLKDSDLVNIEEGIFYYLTHTRGNTTNSKDIIPNEDLKKITIEAKKLAKQSIKNALCYLIYYIGLETELRITQAINLDVNCVQETGMKNKYTIKSKSKTSNGEFIEQAITIYTKRHIDEIVRLTKNYRQLCDDDKIKNKLFIIERGNRKGFLRTIQVQDFNYFMKECCKNAGIKSYSYENLRNTHMTLAEEKVIREGLSDMYQKVLTGHSNVDTDTRSYVNTDIRNILESVHGVIIGDVNLAGEIVSQNNAFIKDENLVSNKCGYCKSQACNNFSYLDCMMCSSFATTINRLPYFEEQVKIIDSKIEQTTNNHDKEDLVNIKRLLISYIEKIVEKQEDLNAK